MANTFKFGTNGNWAVKDGSALAYNDENNNFKPLPFDFTRASSATRVNKQGLIETVPSGKPRIDFLNNTSGHLLLEPSRTNIVFYSEQLNNSVWNKLTNTTVTANQIVSPDGSQNADEFSATSTSTSLMAVQDGFSVFSSVDYVISFFAKKGSVRYVQLFNGGGQVTGNPRTNFNLQDGNVAIQDGGHTSSIEDFGNGWYRCTTKVTTLSTTLQMYINGVSTSTASRSSTSSWTSGDNFYVWGAQLEAGSYPTSYIKTTSGQVTRSADVCNGAGTSAEFNDSEGVLFAEIADFYDSATSRVISISDSTLNNRVFFKFYTASNGIQATLVSSTGGTNPQITATTNNTSDFNKIALKYSANGFNLWANGFELGSDTITNLPNNLNDLSFDTATLNDFYGKSKQVMTFKTALTDSELETLTSWDSFNAMATGQLYTIE
jgi:hypothetical protein